ncbi:MAG: lysophospholipid acyltransferase family protein [Opitutales bacterium]
MSKAGTKPGKSGAIHDLRIWHRFLLRLLVGAMRLWASTLRLQIPAECHAYWEALKERPGLVVVWHNRLFMGPELLHRYVHKGQMAALVSASADGAWMSAVLELFGIAPVRGSRNRRGRKALLELVAARQAGKSILITPDGSRGPVYVMKPGAAALARETESDVYLLSINFSRAWRLRSWDRFYLPKPFSRLEMRVQCVPAEALMAATSCEAATKMLEGALNDLTEDELLGKGVNAEP